MDSYSHIGDALLQLGDCNAGVVDEAEQLLQAVGHLGRLRPHALPGPALQVSEQYQRKKFESKS